MWYWIGFLAIAKKKNQQATKKTDAAAEWERYTSEVPLTLQLKKLFDREDPSCSFLAGFDEMMEQLEETYRNTWPAPTADSASILSAYIEPLDTWLLENKIISKLVSKEVAKNNLFKWMEQEMHQYLKHDPLAIRAMKMIVDDMTAYLDKDGVTKDTTVFHYCEDHEMGGFEAFQHHPYVERNGNYYFDLSIDLPFRPFEGFA